MAHQILTKRTGMMAALTILSLCVAFGSATVARADDPPKKTGDGKVQFHVGRVIKTPDKNVIAPKPPGGNKPDPGKGKQAPPKAN